MSQVEPQAPGRFDAVYVSPHAEDALLSCPARMLSERAQGLRVLVLVAFSATEDAGEAGRALERLGLSVSRVGLSAASERNAAYRSYSRACFERVAEDARTLETLAERITDLVLATRARHVYLPLGAGGHIDRRLSHEAGLRALHELTGRNVFLYEERPQALLPGVVRIRLSELGARLPPGAARVDDDPSMARVVLSLSRAPFLKGEGVPLLELARTLRRVAHGLRASRAWRPLRALGLRLQPVVEQASASDFDGLLGVMAGVEPRLAQLFGSRERMAAQARRHARLIGAEDYAERYWLLLPPRDERGLGTLPAADPGRGIDAEARPAS